MAEFDIACESKSKSQQTLEAQSLAAGALPPGRNRRPDHRRSTKSDLSGSGGNPSAHESGDLHRQVCCRLSSPANPNSRRSSSFRNSASSANASCCAAAPTTLSQEQTQEYIANACGLQAPLEGRYSAQRLSKTIHVYSLGIPRVINLLCEHSLVNAFVEH